MATVIYNFINGEKATTKSNGISLSVMLSMDSEDKFSFRLRPTIGYNISKTSLATSVNNNYFTYGGRANVSIDLPGKMEFMTDVNADLRQRINAFAIKHQPGNLECQFIQKDL